MQEFIAIIRIASPHWQKSPHQQTHFPGRHNQASLLFSLLWSCLTLTLLLYQTWFEVLGKGLCYYHCGERRWWWYSWFGLVEAERGQRMASAEQTQHCTVALIAKFYPQIIADFVDLRDWDILLDLKSDVYYRFSMTKTNIQKIFWCNWNKNFGLRNENKVKGTPIQSSLISKNFEKYQINRP